MTHTDHELADLWRERQQALADYEAAEEEDSEEERHAWDRHIEADAALRAARPRTLAGLAVLALLLEDSLKTGAAPREVDAVLADYIAERLVAMAAG